MKTKFSIRWVLTMWNMALLAAVLATLLFLHYHLYRKSLVAEMDASLQNAMVSAIPSVVPPGFAPRGGRPPRSAPPPLEPPDAGGPPPESELDEAFMKEVELGNRYLIVWNPDGELEHRYGNAPDAAIDVYIGHKEEQYFTIRNGFRELIAHHPSGALIVVGQSMKEINHQLKRTRGYLTLIGCAIFLLGYAGGRYIVGKALKPIHQISRTAEEIAEGDHSQRIELSAAPEELASLAQTLNNSFNHLNTALENQKRFSADASHELRTPIAVVLAQAQAALKRDRSTDEYKTVLKACERAGLRMKAMADDLLDLTRIDGNENLLNKERYSLNEMLSQATRDATHLSDKHPIDIQLTEIPLEPEIDRGRMHRVFMNLLANAINHNPDGCAILVTLEKEQNNAVIRITDDGVGIPEEALPHIFDRFYRVDKARSRGQGGSGLGLSIVKSLVEAHGGTIEATSEPGRRTTFTIVLPLQ